MKTKIITKLKKELLIIEFPEGYELADVTYGAIYYYDNQMNDEDYPLSVLVEGSYTLLGKPEEIREGDAKNLVEQSIFTSLYGHYVSGIDVNTYCYKTALDSFNSALESEVYWENPVSKQLGFIGNVSEIDKQIALQKQKRRFDEAQEKTFDRKRTLIFVKN